jgi:hypothetical protein
MMRWTIYARQIVENTGMDLGGTAALKNGEREHEKMRVAVVGAGVIGVTSAFAVKSAFPSCDVTIFADAFSPDTTGDGSAGLWGPYLLGDTPVENIT